MTAAGDGQQKGAAAVNKRVDNHTISNGKNERQMTEQGADNGAGKGHNNLILMGVVKAGRCWQ